jgi:two-component system OmpR family response regulator
MPDSRQILVVEDEKHLAAGIKYNLEEEGYRVLLAEDGRKAWDLVHDHPGGVDLIILDLMLPGMSGYALCEALRKNGHQMPVLILSARTLAEDKARGFDVGANQYLVKPFDLDELLSRVKNLLAMGPVGNWASPATSKPGTADAETFSFAECTVNFRTYQLECRGKSVRLTSLQIKVLRYLIRHAGRVVPRAELLENVWGMPGNMRTRAPDQIIRQLRKLCEPNPARPQYLLTIRDAGYQFIPEPESVAD